MTDGGFTLDDVKEEEVILSDLYVFLVKMIAEKNGEHVSVVSVPQAIDFRVKPEDLTV